MRPSVSILTGLLTAGFAANAMATVFINEVLINPPTSAADDTREYIELHGTPFMKLDGYAVFTVSGTQQKYYPLNFFDPMCPPNDIFCPGFGVTPEIDEFFSLDGLALGANGMLVIGIGSSSQYPALLSDTAFQQWTTLFNGGLDTVGKLENDGSNTLMLIRNRPGITEADPGNPLGLRWGKDIEVDFELFTPEINPATGNPSDLFGDGNLDIGQFNPAFMLNTLDLLGATTVDSSDDLEIVDEVSYEHDQGWEYEIDERHVDIDSPVAGLPYRHVHALDDPQGLNPDALSRVDYRTKGPGWNPAPGATGETGPGLTKNWQDTATEQWIRGETRTTTGSGGSPPYFFRNDANTNVDAIQPFNTQVPLWLNDGSGTEYSFSLNFYEVMPGRVNPLAIPFIPGDTDRDGDCDADDIAKLAGVFGDDNWIFSNAFPGMPGNGGDPATQTRPWDVDATGDNGIEPSDLQWTLNFQGNTNGRIVGVRYDSTTPSATGVVLNSNAGVNCAVTALVNSPCGRGPAGLMIGDQVQVIVRGQVTGGVNNTAGQQNGIMQFVQDVALSTGGVLQVTSVEALGAFAKTRESIESPQGASGDLGMRRINGHATSFTQGLGSAADLYRVTLLAVAPGSASLSVSAASETKFTASTPGGLKVGHTNNFGNPASVSYGSASVALTVTSAPLGDIDGNSVRNLADVSPFVNVLLELDMTPLHVQRSDINCDGAADGDDISLFVDLLL